MRSGDESRQRSGITGAGKNGRTHQKDRAKHLEAMLEETSRHSKRRLRDQVRPVSLGELWSEARVRLRLLVESSGFMPERLEHVCRLE